jgi:hypothetical protein
MVSTKNRSCNNLRPAMNGTATSRAMSMTPTIAAIVEALVRVVMR